MRFSLAAAAAALAPVLFAAAEDHLILVGANGQLAFSPTNITAAAGDTVSFQFQAKNHSVTQSSFINPCAIQTTPAPGINSGFQFVSNTSTTLPQWSFTVDNATTPLWFFCAQTNPASHCQAGMVFSVNANPNSAKSFAIYQQAAMGNPAAIESAAAASASAAAGGAAAGATGATDSAAGAAPTDSAAGAAPTDSSAAAATDGANAINSAANTLTNAAGGASPTTTAGQGLGNGTSPSAGFRLSGNTFSLVAAVGLTAMLL